MTDDPFVIEPIHPDMMHYGILRKSGRYPWGSGGDEYTRSMDFFAMDKALKANNIPEVERAQAMGLSVADYRSTKTIAKEQVVLEQTNRAVALKDKGVSLEEISRDLGIPKPTVRLRIANSENIKQSSLRNTAEVLRAAVDKHQIVDVGKGVALQMGIADTKLKAALSVLRDEGYETHTVPIKNVGTNNNTNGKVLVPPGTGFGGARRLTPKMHTMGEWTEDEGKTYFGIHDPISINPKRMQVRYKEDGGHLEDGIIYVRPGAKDLDMGANTYAQVRIKIGDNHYAKGVAILKNDMPDGVDLIFNSNKSKKDPKILKDGDLGALKPLTDDKDNPFGSVIKRQIVKIDPKTGEEKNVSAMNILREEGDWDEWNNSLPSQMLAKQPHSLIKSQLQVTRDETRNRLGEIEKITNPVIRQDALDKFASKVDADAVDLRAAAMPRQRTQLLVPMPKINEHEVYAPRFDTGDRLVLIRYPHGGRFEIPEVVVNNNHRPGKKLLGDAPDAIGVHPKVAEKLSGADFDGDTVVAIPNRGGKIKGSQSLGTQAKVYEQHLNDFDAKRKYGGYEEKDGKGNFSLMKNTGMEMGMITNLITDMSIQGAKAEHVVRAVKHSMVVIDAEKHKLNYRQSEIDNGIKQLRELYQAKPTGGKAGGATTLLSQATAKEYVNERKALSAAKGGRIDPKTGAERFEETGRTQNKYDPKTKTYDPNVTVPKQQRVKRLALTDDAYTLVRDKADPVERLYADHANEMKSIANEARLKAYHTTMPKINPQARVVYKDAVDKLKYDLKEAQKTKPLERRADNIAGEIVRLKRQEDPLLRTDRDRLKKVERQAKAASRARLNLQKPVINITDEQWDAIQRGAVSASKLREILEYADPVRVAQLSMPRTNTVVTKAVSGRAKAMLNSGATTGEVAAALGISVSTLRSAIERGDL